MRIFYHVVSYFRELQQNTIYGADGTQLDICPRLKLQEERNNECIKDFTYLYTYMRTYIHTHTYIYTSFVDLCSETFLISHQETSNLQFPYFKSRF
jgi:hypothetical protein